MDGVGLERVNEYKYFGVWLSDTLGWSEQVNKIVQRASRQTGMIYRNFYPHSSQETLLMLYLAHVRPLLECASQVWYPYHKAQIDSLERVQKAWVEDVMQAVEVCDYESLLARTESTSKALKAH